MLLPSSIPRKAICHNWPLVLGFLFLVGTGAPHQQSGAAPVEEKTAVGIEEVSAPRRVWAGEEVKVTITLCNTQASERAIHLAWSVTAASAVLERGSQEAVVPAAQKCQVVFSIHAPQVKRRVE